MAVIIPNAKGFQLKNGNKKPENEFRSTCIRWLSIRFAGKFLNRKIHGGPYQKVGTLDTYCSIRGQFFAFEWKDPKRRYQPNPKQEKEVAEIRAAGGRAYIIRSFQELEEAVADIEPVQRGMR